MKIESTSLKTVLLMIGAMFAIGLLLGHLYDVASFVAESTPVRQLHLEAWAKALCVNTVLAIGAAIWMWRNRPELPSFAVDPSLMKIAYGPTVAILGGSIILALASRILFPGATQASIHWHVWVWVFIVPIVEELIFRVRIGEWFRRLGGPLWGAWFSAALFSFVHTQPTFEKMIALEIGLPLGPFLLGLMCEVIYIKTRRLLPIVILHGICNGTVVIFSLIDSRWFAWLSLLYS